MKVHFLSQFPQNGRRLKEFSVVNSIKFPYSCFSKLPVVELLKGTTRSARTLNTHTLTHTHSHSQSHFYTVKSEFVKDSKPNGKEEWEIKMRILFGGKNKTDGQFQQATLFS